MSTLAATTPPATDPRSTLAGVMRGEWVKLLSLRSTWWTLAATVVLMTLVSFAAAMSLDAMAADPVMGAAMADMHGADVISGGFQVGMLSIAVLGALFITGEYSTGMIRSTFAAVPTRLPVLGAKAVALVVLTVAVTVVGVTTSALATVPQLATYDLVPALDDPATWRVLGGTTYFLVAAALFTLGVGTLLRSTAATVTVALTVLLVLPGVLSFITLDWVETLVGYLPLPASSAFLTAGATDVRGVGLTAGSGLLVVAAYAVVPMVAAAVALRRRDA